MNHAKEEILRRLPIIIAAFAFSMGIAFAQSTTPNAAGGDAGTGNANKAINGAGNADSTVNASGTINQVAPTALEKGANSFTEGQARSRIESAGFTAVTDLKVDNDGIWRGKATKDGKSLTVGFDFKGNLAAQ